MNKEPNKVICPCLTMEHKKEQREHQLTVELLHINVWLLNSFRFNYSVLQTTWWQCVSIEKLVIFQNNDFILLIPSMIVRNENHFKKRVETLIS